VREALTAIALFTCLVVGFAYAIPRLVRRRPSQVDASTLERFHREDRNGGTS
jgi:hypothetical protein